jgi:hypothetical protein
MVLQKKNSALRMRFPRVWEIMSKKVHQAGRARAASNAALGTPKPDGTGLWLSLVRQVGHL